ncbi:MAG TPA: hypothetical protein VIZ22_13185 [Candidatus Limnocylindrales bacterium]
MLNGRWPRVTAAGVPLTELEADVAAETVAVDALGAAIDDLVARVVGVQVDAGLDVVTDGSVRFPDPGGALLRALAANDLGPQGYLVRTWQAAALLSDRVVAQPIPGPYSLSRRVHDDQSALQREDFTLEMASYLAAELRALAAAGCQMALIEEPDVVLIGGYPAPNTNVIERELFAATQSHLLAEPVGLHAMLVVTGGSAWAAGPEAVLGAPYQSYLFDLIAGPDNWNLIREVPGDRGVVCGALRAEAAADQLPELVWAARYAASSNGRGLERVGLSNATSLADLDADAVGRAAAALAKASRLARLSPDQAVAEGLDPRAIRQPDTRPPHVRRPKPASGG